jgi:hypothetical protein
MNKSGGIKTSPSLKVRRGLNRHTNSVYTQKYHIEKYVESSSHVDNENVRMEMKFLSNALILANTLDTHLESSRIEEWGMLTYLVQIRNKHSIHFCQSIGTKQRIKRGWGADLYQ